MKTGLSVTIRRECGHCGKVSETKHDIRPEQMSDTFWEHDECDWNCLAADSRLPGQIFCSTECKYAALDKAGIDYSKDPPSFA